MRPQARPFGSSGLAALLGVGVFLFALLVAGVLVFRDDDDQDDFALTSSTPTATAEVGGSLLGTPTTESESTPSPSATTGTQPAASPTQGTASPTPRVFPTLTPSPTTEPEAVAEEEDEPEVEEPADPTSAPDDSDEEPVDPEPTTPPEEVEEPVEEPFVGDFGTLPPPQLPSGGASQQLTLDYQLATSLELVPLSATVYEVQWPSYSEDDVAWMADNLGVDGEIETQGDGVYSVSGSEAALFVAPTIIEYGTYTAGSGGPLPSSDVAIDAAWTWFSALGISGVEAGDSSIVAVEEGAGLSVVSISPAYPSPNLAPTPSARIKVSADGIVEEATVVWPSSLVGSDYGLKSGLDVWEELRAGNAFVSADLSESGGGSATVNVTDVSIAYTVAGSPWDGQYMVPLVVFGGTANVNGVEIYVSAYVPAVYHQGNTSG